MSTVKTAKISKISKPVLYLSLAMICMLAGIIISRRLYNQYNQDLFLTLYVTFLTFFYHFAMRILVGEGITIVFRYREFHYDAAWYRHHKGEAAFYQMIKIKSWKLKLITAKPEQFDIKKRSYEELLHNMTQAEVVHEIIMVLSFVPLFLIIPYGAPMVFVVTSVIACMIDFLFVMIQRYNRPRLLRIKKKMNRVSS